MTAPRPRRPRPGRARAPVLALALAACGPGPAPSSPSPLPPLPPGITVTLHEESYTVTGRTVEEIGRSLEAMAPAVRNRRVRGVHSWALRWTYRLVPRDGACHVDGVEVEMTSTILLPRWSRPAGADPALVEAWEVYLEQIRAHESGHRELGLEAAVAVRRELEATEGPRCTEGMNDRVQEAGARILQAAHERNRAFDRRAPPLVWPP